MMEFNAEKKICLPKRQLCEIRQIFLHVLIEGSNMFFHSLTFQGPEGSVENCPRFSIFPRDHANLNE